MITADVQGLEPGSLWEGFEIDATELGIGVMRYHGYGSAGDITWQGQLYTAWPIRGEGFARTSDRPPNPILVVGNIDGSVSALTMFYEDMVGAKITRHRTLTRYLDAVNFPGGVNAEADPGEHMPPEIWYIERKSGEESDTVQFELSGADFNGLLIPKRQIIPNNCPWKYRSAECSYTGPPVATIMDAPTTDPVLDRCGKRLGSCKLRFGADAELPFGGFPAADLMR